LKLGEKLMSIEWYFDGSIYIDFSKKKKRACGREVAAYMCYNTIGYDLAFQQKKIDSIF
jgi:hypothetical protein